MSKLLPISHLLLGEKTVRPAEGGNPNSFGKMGGNQWDALRASHLLASSKPLSSILVGERGLEPPRIIHPLGPKPSASTIPPLALGVFVVKKAYLGPTLACLDFFGNMCYFLRSLGQCLEGHFGLKNQARGLVVWQFFVVRGAAIVSVLCRGTSYGREAVEEKEKKWE